MAESLPGRPERTSRYNHYRPRPLARGNTDFFRSPPEKLVRENRQDSQTGEEKFCRCVHCGAVITRLDTAIAVSGGHEHTFCNPMGLVFTVRLFHSAPGCRFHGPPSPEFSWFPGYLWRLAACGGCGRHLGWLFQGEGDRFVALIATAIQA